LDADCPGWREEMVRDDVEDSLRGEVGAEG
jgi:hypothetical protein